VAGGEQSFKEGDYIPAAVGINPEIVKGMVVGVVSLYFLCNPLCVDEKARRVRCVELFVFQACTNKSTQHMRRSPPREVVGCSEGKAKF
jgi:hypothetical protein